MSPAPSGTRPGATCASSMKSRAPRSVRNSDRAGRCKHAANQPHAKGEWIGAEIRLETPLLAQYAVSHYLEQERVLDADVVD